jgi:hypothetical protein
VEWKAICKIYVESTNVYDKQMTCISCNTARLLHRVKIALGGVSKGVFHWRVLQAMHPHWTDPVRITSQHTAVQPEYQNICIQQHSTTRA